jgi:CheY-like chemotaxis protein
LSLILLVDDDPLVLDAVRRPLEKAGHAVACFDDGGAALDWTSRQQPDVVILDIVMPRLSGYDVCRRLRRQPHTRRLPVIFLTSKNQLEDEAQARAAGSDLFLTKPVLATRLLRLVGEQLPPAAPPGGDAA